MSETINSLTFTHRTLCVCPPTWWFDFLLADDANRLVPAEPDRAPLEEIVGLPLGAWMKLRSEIRVFRGF